ncbi:MAG: hypothetical protein JRG76_01845 [Deltaproteobacteria bacterium]|nr:hypothetical protein [Deltaproteobacteria bacterium]
MLLVLALCVTSVGCYRFTVRPENTQIVDWRSKTVHSYAWNLIDADPIVVAHDCGSKGLYAARAKTNLAFIWAGFLTLGGWVPMTLEWRCVE